jgi:hypothetical protein
MKKVRTTGRDEAVTGKWLAWNREQTRVVASGQTRAEASKAAREAGEGEPVLENVEETRRAFADLYAQGTDLRQALLDQEGGSLTVREVSRILGTTPEVVEERRAAGSLLALAEKGDVYIYPSWQFTAQGTVPGLEAVLRDLCRHNRHPLAKVRFFLSPNIRLENQRPLHLLRRGMIDDVRRAARTYGEHGAA